MSMEKTDALFLLVKSLTKSEKRQFKLYAGRLGGNSEKNFIALFSVLDKLVVFDERQILLKTNIKKQQLSNSKAHLYRQILVSLKLNPIHQNAKMQVREQLDFATILYNKGLHKQSLKVLDKRSGKVAWEQKYRMLNRYSGHYPLMAVLSDTDVYVMVARTRANAALRPTGVQAQLPVIYSYNLHTGKLNWKAGIAGKKTASAMVGSLVLTAKHLITAVRSRVYKARKLTINDEVRMFDAVTGKRVHARVATGAYDPRRPAYRVYVNVPPAALARGNTLVVDGAKGPTAYRKQ